MTYSSRGVTKNTLISFFSSNHMSLKEVKAWSAQSRSMKNQN